MRPALAFALLLAAGCSKMTSEPAPTAEIRLSRTPGGAFAVELAASPTAARAVQAEITIDSTSAYVLDAAEAPAGLPLDTVRVSMRGTNRALLFAGDKRGVRLPRDGAIAQFVLDASGTADTGGTIRIRSALVVGTDGAQLDIKPAPAISIR